MSKVLFHQKPLCSWKTFAYNMTKIYRESYNVFGSNGILFNHESPHRGETFVTRKITRAVGRIKQGIQKNLTLGNLNAKRDWGFAGDYVEAMWLIMQNENPDDWVIATGESHSVENFAKKAFELVELDWKDYVVVDEKHFRPNEVKYLLGDSSKARKELSWKPKTTFDELVEMMVKSDLKLAESEKVLMEKGLLMPTWESPII